MKENTLAIRTILIDNFQVNNFDWETPLAVLQPKFRLLAYLIEFQALLSTALEQDIILVGNVNTLEHTPNDVVKIIHNNKH